MPKIKVSLSIGFSNAKQKEVIEIDEAEWKSCKNDKERNELIDQYAIDWSNDYIDISTELIE